MNPSFQFIENDLKGSYLIKPIIHEDHRGLFIKDFSKDIFQSNDIHHDMKEVFYTHSKKGVLRGIHFQINKEQAKLVRCIKGKVFDVIVDLRKDSPTYGKWQSFMLSESNFDMLYVPKQFGHGYLVLEDAIVSYQCDEHFYPVYDDGIIWHDETLRIAWPLDLIDEVIVSKKDETLQTFLMFDQK